MPTMNGFGAASAQGSSEEAQGLSRKRVANAVRKVVSKVLPGEEPGSTKDPPSRGVKSLEYPARGKKGEKAAPVPKPPPPPPAPPAPPKPEAKKEAAKDELSLGLWSLMSRGRAKEHKPHGRQSPGKGEKPSSQQPGSSEKPSSPIKPELPEEQCSPNPLEEPVDPGSLGSKPDLVGLQQPDSSAPDVLQEVSTECATNFPSPPLPSKWLPGSLASLAQLGWGGATSSGRGCVTCLEDVP